MEEEQEQVEESVKERRKEDTGREGGGAGGKRKDSRKWNMLCGPVLPHAFYNFIHSVFNLAVI